MRYVTFIENTFGTFTELVLKHVVNAKPGDLIYHNLHRLVWMNYYHTIFSCGFFFIFLLRKKTFSRIRCTYHVYIYYTYVNNNYCLYLFIFS